MSRHTVAQGLCGWLTAGLSLVVVTFFGIISLAGMFYEDWGQGWPVLLRSLLPWLALFLVVLAALCDPRRGGWILAAVTGVSAGLWLWRQAERGILSWALLPQVAVMFGPLLVLATLFLIQARRRKSLGGDISEPEGRWPARHLPLVLVAGVPLLAMAGFSAVKLPPLLARHDDGLRCARTIHSNGVDLVWAPQGPGWNWKLPSGDMPTWNMLAQYGAPPVGLTEKQTRGPLHPTSDDMRTTGFCAFLNEEGTALLDYPAGFWRMPTVDDIVRSLTRQGENAGCTWDGRSQEAVCDRPPDKETPLWAPNESPIYYWAAHEADARNAFCVNFNAGINFQAKSWKNRSIGFRCVKDLPPILNNPIERTTKTVN